MNQRRPIYMRENILPAARAGGVANVGRPGDSAAQAVQLYPAAQFLTQ